MSNSQSQNQADSAEKPQQKPQVLEEDDEFEDFPVEGPIPPLDAFMVSHQNH